MKRLLTLVLVLTLAFTMTSCDIVFEILDAFLSEEDGEFGDIGGTGEKVEVDVLADTGREKDPENPYSSLHSGYNFTPASGEDKIWKVESLKDIDRAFDYAIANCQATVYMDFANVLDGYKKIDDFFKNEYLPNAQKELGYITGYQYSYKGTVVLFTLKYNNNAASFILDKTDKNNYENYKNGNKEAKLDIIANAIGYTTLLENHIQKEDNVIFNFAKRGLSEELIETMNKECFEYEQTYFDSMKEHIDNLIYLEEKYI
jgi:hypothetical protein